MLKPTYDPSGLPIIDSIHDDPEFVDVTFRIAGIGHGRGGERIPALMVRLNSIFRP